MLATLNYVFISNYLTMKNMEKSDLRNVTDFALTPEFFHQTFSVAGIYLGQGYYMRTVRAALSALSTEKQHALLCLLDLQWCTCLVVVNVCNGFESDEEKKDYSNDTIDARLELNSQLREEFGLRHKRAVTISDCISSF